MSADPARRLGVMVHAWFLTGRAAPLTVPADLAEELDAQTPGWPPGTRATLEINTVSNVRIHRRPDGRLDVTAAPAPLGVRPHVYLTPPAPTGMCARCGPAAGGTCNGWITWTAQKEEDMGSATEQAARARDRTEARYAAALDNAAAALAELGDRGGTDDATMARHVLDAAGLPGILDTLAAAEARADATRPEAP